jgi:hypothetical protein
MLEPRPLTSARAHLSRAETAYDTKEGLRRLEEGLALLDEVIATDSADYGTVARNLATTYSNRIVSAIRARVETDHAIPEPDLEHLFKVMLAFDQVDFELPADAPALKISIARRLIDLYYEGCSPADKEKALQQLAQISQGDGSRARRRRRTGPDN